MKTLHVSAGGTGSRIKSYIKDMMLDTPKHLLPLPNRAGSVLGQIITQAEEFHRVIVWSGSTNHAVLTSTFGRHSQVRVKVDTNMTGPLGPMVRGLVKSQKRAYGCAGDFYCDFSWSAFERFHESHGLPVSILVARSVPAPEGARFLLDGHRIVGWERVTETTREDRINIGAYIVDPEPRLLNCLAELVRHKEDPFFDACIGAGIIAGYDPGCLGYNINVAEVYEALVISF